MFATRLAALRFSASGGLVGRHREVVSFVQYGVGLYANQGSAVFAANLLAAPTVPGPWFEPILACLIVMKTWPLWLAAFLGPRALGHTRSSQSTVILTALVLVSGREVRVCRVDSKPRCNHLIGLVAFSSVPLMSSAKSKPAWLAAHCCAVQSLFLYRDKRDKSGQKGQFGTKCQVRAVDSKLCRAWLG